MAEINKLTDVFASVLAEGPLKLRDIRERAALVDERADLLPMHAVEQLLEFDERFTSSGEFWQLTPDAPVPGAKSGTTGTLPEEVSAPHVETFADFVVLDVEATDPEPSKAELIEVAAIKVRDWEIVDTFVSLVFCEEIPLQVSTLTGILPTDLRTAPGSADVIHNLATFVGGLPILGQNVRYDVAVIQRVDPSFEPSLLLEVLELAHIVYPQATGRTLVELAALTGVEVPEAHRALADCETVLQVAKRLVDTLNAPTDLSDFIRSILRRGRNPWSGLLRATAVQEPHVDAIQRSGAPWLRHLDEGQPARAPTSAEVFGPTGLLAQVSRDVDFRPAQLEMAETVESALAEGQRLMVEAPTGTGKTYAYLVPGLRAASETGRPIWISTNTKALQTQLQGDFARLKDAGVIDGDLAVLKGKDNYVCTRDLFAAASDDLDPRAAVEVATILSLLWTSGEGEIGEATDFWLINSYPEAAQIKNELRLNPATCDGANCEFVSVCPYYTARRHASAASAVAVNHALLITAFADENPPQISGLIIDEAHTLEDAATSALTVELDPRSINAWLNQLIDSRSSSGLLRNVGRAFGFSAREDPSFASGSESVRRAKSAIQTFTDRLTTYLGEFVGRPDFGDYAISHRFRVGVDDNRYLFLEARQALFTFAEISKQIMDALRELLALSAEREAIDGFNGSALRRRLRAEAARADELVELALQLLVLSNDEYVTYATWEASDGEFPALTVTRVPVDVSPVLEGVYDRVPVVIATSATLSIGGSFAFMRSRLAATDFSEHQVQETFDYAKQASLILTRHLPAPVSSNEEEFVEAVADTAIAAIGTARGGTLGLFTSRKRLAAAFARTEPGVRFEGLELRAQLPRTSNRELAAWFRESEDASLFGLRSFWQGFDAPGESLRLLLVEKLPFPSPADPVFAARSGRIEASGADPFYDYAVPLTALALKQGFGRLIRTRTDQGVAVILDRRVRTGLSYQAEILGSLPTDIPTRFPVDETEFLKMLAADLKMEPRLDLATGVGPLSAVLDLQRTTARDTENPVELSRALKEVQNLFQIEAFRPGQEELIRAVVGEKRDVVGILPTGSGKSLIYQAASMILDGVGLVITPLVALMKDQVDRLRHDYGFKWAYALYGGQSASDRDAVLDAVRAGGCRLLYVSPERLRDPSLLRTLANARITFVAVDEAHCVSAWGHDFRPDFLTIVSSIARLPNATDAPRIALTATAPDEILHDIQKQLQLRDPLVIRGSVDRPNIHFSVIKCRTRKEKRSELLRVALAYEDAPGVVYCATRNDAESAAALLSSHGVSARHYHAGMPPEQRQAVQDMFMSDQVRIICATNAFGLGIDKPDIGFVVHWSLPLSLESYVQEAGRAARDPRTTGSAVLIWTSSDIQTLRRLANSSMPTIEDLEKLQRDIATLPAPYVTLEDLARRTGFDDIAIRVGIHLLEQGGAISQGPDVAAKAFIAIPNSMSRIRSRFGDETAEKVAAVSSAIDVSAPGRGIVDMISAAARIGTDAADLEQTLLELAEQEALGYRPIQRAMNLQPGNGDWDRGSVETRLTALRRSSFRRLDEIQRYAEKNRCRRAQILAHFGEAPAECSSCDICTGVPPELAKVPPSRYRDVSVVTEQAASAIFGIVREASRFGSPLSRNSFVKGLKGTSRFGSYEISQVLQRSRWFGSLRYLTETEINEAIDTLIERGRILAVEHETRDGDTYIGLDVTLR